MSKRALVLGLAAVLGVGACGGGGGGGGDSEFIVSNRSDYVLEEVHIADINDPSWGPNLLPDVLFPGEDLVIIDIQCGTYDVLVVDELGASCELRNEDLCFSSNQWVIDNFVLDTCAFAKRSTPATRAPEAAKSI